MPKLQKMQHSTKALLEQIAEQETEELLSEGLLDIVKSFAGKTKDVAVGAFDKVKALMSAGVQKLKNFVGDRVNKLQQASQQLSFVDEIKKEAEQESGEKFPVDQAMQLAMALPKLAQEATSEAQQTEQEAKQVAQQPEQQTQPAQAPGASPQQQGTLQESFSSVSGLKTFTGLVAATAVMSEQAEITRKKHLSEHKEAMMNESLTLAGIMGLTLGVVGGMPMVIKGLMKLTNWLKLTKVTKALEGAYHVAEHLEEKVIDYAIPDKLSYAAYKALFNRGIKVTPNLMPQEGWQHADAARHQVEQLMYKMMLGFFAFNGLASALKAGVSVLGAAESAATAVKGIEIAKGIQQATALGV